MNKQLIVQNKVVQQNWLAEVSRKDESQYDLMIANAIYLQTLDNKQKENNFYSQAIILYQDEKDKIQKGVNNLLIHDRKKLRQELQQQYMNCEDMQVVGQKISAKLKKCLTRNFDIMKYSDSIQKQNNLFIQVDKKQQHNNNEIEVLELQNKLEKQRNKFWKFQWNHKEVVDFQYRIIMYSVKNKQTICFYLKNTKEFDIIGNYLLCKSLMRVVGEDWLQQCFQQQRQVFMNILLKQFSKSIENEAKKIEEENKKKQQKFQQQQQDREKQIKQNQLNNCKFINSLDDILIKQLLTKCKSLTLDIDDVDENIYKQIDIKCSQKGVGSRNILIQSFIQ